MYSLEKNALNLNTIDFASADTADVYRKNSILSLFQRLFMNVDSTSSTNVYQNVVWEAIENNSSATEVEIYNSIIKEKPSLEKNKDFNETFLTLYHRKKPVIYNFKADNHKNYDNIPKPTMMSSLSGRNSCFEG